MSPSPVPSTAGASRWSAACKSEIGSNREPVKTRAIESAVEVRSNVVPPLKKSWLTSRCAKPAKQPRCIGISSCRSYLKLRDFQLFGFEFFGEFLAEPDRPDRIDRSVGDRRGQHSSVVEPGTPVEDACDCRKDDILPIKEGGPFIEVGQAE